MLDIITEAGPLRNTLDYAPQRMRFVAEHELSLLWNAMGSVVILP